MKRKKMALSSDKIFDIFNYTFLILLIVIVAYPLYYVLIASISDPYEVYAGKTFLLPSKLTLEGYVRVFKEQSIATGYLNSIYYTILGTAVSVALIIVTGYCVSKKTLPFRRTIMLFYVFTMYFNGGLIPTYLVVSKLGMLNSVWALILPGGVAVFNVIVARTFFESSIPEELYEAASIDGSSNIGTFVKIALPLSKPILAVMVIFTMVAYWNDWFTALIYMSEKSRYPLQLALRQILIQSQAMASMMGNMDGGYAEANKVTELIKFASIVVGSVPMLIAYPFVQKYFEKGFMAGAVKG
ncbi:MAG TPA: carbohydrate ABC transporter permease [Candidatus Eisenbergiella pullistercoris]|uniref:Carbohydrate ABC transporter permease n=1 Tax=Candidatus Eisenbergiella pullistercoris TaxID=2838555 RepID=A0A9D1YNE7_9FIRM|nr:carbohydrate ABC transporter permease [Candidatus Eisenbergiella pullistercoris]